MVARIVTKARKKYDKLFEIFILIPWLLPSTMIALGLMMTYDEPRFLLADKVLVATPVILLIAYIIIKIPFSYRMIRSRLYWTGWQHGGSSPGYGSKTILYNAQGNSSDPYAD